MPDPLPPPQPPEGARITVALSHAQNALGEVDNCGVCLWLNVEDVRVLRGLASLAVEAERFVGKCRERGCDCQGALWRTRFDRIAEGGDA